jgi:redox-sensitive bicupin YhaK (pirin superfamily)
MEIITYIVQGALEHKDSMGNGSVIRAGDVQRMSAGTGILHSEFNPSPREPVHLIQIWVQPNKRGLIPEYDQQTIPETEKMGRLKLLASHDGRDGSMTIHQDASLFATVLNSGDEVEHDLAPNRYGWVQVIRGEIVVRDKLMAAGDGASVRGEQSIKLKARNSSEALLFDLA